VCRLTPQVHFGDEALRLHHAAADAALPGRDQVIAARDLAQAAEFISHTTGLIADMPPAGEVDALLTEARALAAGDLAAKARVRSIGMPGGPALLAAAASWKMKD
jgi:O-acetyl-ADP-ribose deacetylase (regulator of RNase III)